MAAREIIEIVLGISALVGLLWKIFDVKATLDVKIQSNRHLIELLQQATTHHDEKLTLSINGLNEVANHVRTRTQHDHDKIDNRLRNLENFAIQKIGYRMRNTDN